MGIRPGARASGGLDRSLKIPPNRRPHHGAMPAVGRFMIEMGDDAAPASSPREHGDMSSKTASTQRWRFLAPGRRLPGSPLAFLLLAVAVAAGGWNYAAGTRSRAEAERLGRVMALSEHVLSSMKDLETGQRGYVLTGREDYLQPYEAALARIDGELAAIDAVTPTGGCASAAGA